jgi:uncharacterized membrane protein
MNTRKYVLPVLVAFALMVMMSAQASAQTCVGQTAVKSLSIANTGTEDDTFSVSTSNPDWVDVEDSVFVEAGQTVSIEVAVTPQLVGANTYTVTIIGSKDAPQVITDTENAAECRGVVIIGAPSEVTACEGLDATFEVIIRNLGQITDTYDVSSSAGSLEQPKVTLEPDETVTMNLIIDTEDMDDETEIFISAASGNVVSTHSMMLMVKNCFSAQLTISPDVVSQCPSDSVSYQIYLKNTGELKDEYLLTIMDEVTQTVELGSEESRFFNFSLPLEKGAGSMQVVVTADSEHVSLTDSATLNIKPADECFSARLKKDNVAIEQCTATSVPIELKNNGGQTQTFRFDISGPDWVYLSSERVSVGPGEEKEVYLYISPLYETATDAYSVTINSESEMSEDTLGLTINVMPDTTGYVPPTTPDIPTTPDTPTTPDVPDDTGADDDNMTLNVTIGDETTGAITLGVAPLWKTVVVAFITLIIVVILVVRFAILVKQ